MRILLVISFFISASALACPNLAGNYRSCVSQTNQEIQPSLSITQNIVSGVVVYNVTSTDTQTNETLVETYKADGKLVTASQTDPETGDTMRISTTVSCPTQKALKIKLSVLFNETMVSDIATTVSKNADTLTINTKGTTMGENIDDVVVCN